MPRRLVICALAICALPFGCIQSASIGSLHWTPERPALEIGPVDFTTAQVVASNSAKAFRVEGFGGTRLRLETDGDELTHLFVEGPIGPDEAELPVGLAPVAAEAWGTGARLEISLGRAVYRVIVGAPRGALPVVLRASCDDACAPGYLDPADFLLDSRGASSVLDAIRDQLRDVNDPSTFTKLAAQLDAAASDPSRLPTRFPSVDLQTPGALRPALDCPSRNGQMSDGDYDAGQPAAGELSALLGGCDPKPPAATSFVDAPSVKHGEFADRSFTRCQVAHSQRLASVLNALSAESGSRVQYRGESYETAVSLVQALLEAGHTIEVRNQRSYAGFGGFRWEDYDVRWPIWLNTGLTTLSGKVLVVPLAVSRHAWTIRGPDVDARLTFVVEGQRARFVADTAATPAWAGGRARDVGNSDAEGPDRILETIDFSARYRKRMLADAQSYAQGAGYLGGGNDANAVVEYATRHTVTTFPLRRAAALDGSTLSNLPRGDGLDEIFRALPHDADVPPARQDGLRRLLEMTPLDLNSPLLPDDAFRADIQAVSQEVLGY